MKFNTENSLKRFLKRKVKITLGFVVAFMIMGTGVFAEGILTSNDNLPGQYTEGTFSLGSDEVKITNKNTNQSVFRGNTPGGITVNVGKGQILELVATNGRNSGNEGVIYNTIINNSDNGEKFGTIYLTNNATSGIGVGLGTGTNTITANRVEIEAPTTGITAYGNNTISANNIVIRSSNDGIQAQNDVTIKKVELKEFDTLDIIAENGYGIQNAGWKDCINITGNANSVINIISKGVLDGAIKNQGESSLKIKGGQINLASVATVVTASKGIINLSADKIVIQSVKSFNDDDSINELKNGTAISVSGAGTVNINKDIENKEEKVIEIYGNITANSGTMDLDLLNSSSLVQGKITASSDNAKFTFSNGATWTNTGNSTVKHLTLNDGVINNTGKTTSGTFYNITANNLYGTGGTFNIGFNIKTNTDETREAVSGELELGTVEDKHVHSDIYYKGETTYDLTRVNAEKVLDDLANKITVGDKDSKEFNATAHLEEGYVKGRYTADFTISKDDNDDDVHKVENIGYRLNSMVVGMRDLATINVLTWKQEMSSLNKRMGELRNSNGEHGVWARVYGGEIDNGSQYDNEYQTYQVGFDKKYAIDSGTIFVGGVVSYSTGETTYSLGNGENYSVGAGVYATWFNKNGYFADVILKQSKLHNEFDVNSIDGNKSQQGHYDNWGTSLSGEYGRRFDLTEKFFVEPSVQLTFGRVDDTSCTTSADVDVELDTMYSLIGNVGTTVGYKFSDKGNVYATASFVKEFQGDIDSTYSKFDPTYAEVVTEKISEDLSDTWFEFGIGANYKVKENVSVYADIEKTGNATAGTDWQGSLGFRWEL